MTIKAIDIGYCITCKNDDCPHPQVKQMDGGNCSEWHNGTPIDWDAVETVKVEKVED